MGDPLGIVIRFALYINLMVLFGLPLFALYALRGGERLNNAVLPFRAATIGLGWAALALSLLSIVAMTALMAGVALLDVDRASVLMMVNETPMGIAWQVRMAAGLFAVAAAVASGRRSRADWLVVVVVASAAALATLAWTGHGAANEGVVGQTQLVADIVHLRASGAWIGALVALAILAFRASANMSIDEVRLVHRALEGFSLVGSVIVGLIVITGLVNGYMLVGTANLLLLPNSRYGQLLIVKLALFAAMLALAAANRWRLTPALRSAIHNGNTVPALHLLRRSLVIEAGAASAILALVAWLGTLQPPNGG